MLEQYDLSNLMVLDIETVPQYSNYDEVPDNLQELWAHKSQYQRKDETPKEFYGRAGIWAEFGKIVCISVGIFTNSGGNHPGLRIKSFADHDEKQLLQDFSKMLSGQPLSLILCAHNGKEFDLPYICRRMLINGVQFPPHLQIQSKKPWEIPHLDTMELWKFGDYKNYTSLKLLAACMNVPSPKDDIDGSQVGEVYWTNKDLGRIAAYCQKDVLTVAQLILKFKQMPLLTDEDVIIVS